MPSKKVNAASIAPPPVSDASEPVVKKTRKKAVAAAPVAKKEKAVKAAAPRKKAAPKKVAATENTSIVNLSDALESPRSLDVKDIEVRAYLSWLERGCPEGSPQEDWFRAEKELLAMSAAGGR
jgi:Protein of unknown function (DUF2934)